MPARMHIDPHRFTRGLVRMIFLEAKDVVLRPPKPASLRAGRPANAVKALLSAKIGLEKARRKSAHDRVKATKAKRKHGPDIVIGKKSRVRYASV